MTATKEPVQTVQVICPDCKLIRVLPRNVVTTCPRCGTMFSVPRRAPIVSRQSEGGNPEQWSSTSR